MSLPQVFQNAGMEVRVVVIGETPWWVAKDVCEVLGIKDHNQAVYGNPQRPGTGLDEDERGVYNVTTPSGNQDMIAVNESGLYSLILRSRKPEAKAFKRWITHEVLPAIRKTGGYQKPVTELSRVEILQLALESEKQRLALEVKVQELAPKAKFADAVSNAIDSVSIADFAKAIGTGEIRMFKWLRERGFLFKEGRHNKPYQKYIEQGLFKLIEKTFTDENGEDRTYFRVLITGKGQLKLAEEFKRAA